jgi:protein SCO1/2
VASHAERHAAQGIVVRVEPASGIVIVAHQPIAGYMPAMTMPLRADRARDLDGLTPGARIAFELHVNPRQSRIRKIRRLDGQPVTNGEGAVIQLPKPANQRRVGDPVPDVPLLDQAGRPVRLSQFRGQWVAVQFIYTRCPLPDVCPRHAAHFAYLHRLYGPRLQLLTVTVDPQYDTPSVLSEYARRFAADGEHWRFLTGTDEQVRDFGGLFGLVYWPDEGVITHTSATALISPEGRLDALLEGSTHRADQLRALIDARLRPSASH